MSSKRVKILHIVTDEKFTDGFIDLFDSLQDYENKYVIISDNLYHFRYIKSNNVNIVTINWFVEQCIQSNKYDIIILHSLVGIKQELIHLINKNIKLIWFSWGYDIYEMPLPINPLVKLRHKIGWKWRLKYRIVTIIKFVKRYIVETIIYQSKNIWSWEQAINRIDYYSGVYPEEFFLLKRNTFFRAKKISFNYVSRNSPIKKDKIDNINIKERKNIMIGHQANPLLNHIECLYLLKKMNLPEDISIICPLSYGPKNEIEKIQKVGNKLFGKQFKPILDFLPIEEYMELYDSINIAIFYIQRQCAVGNILIALWNGVKVFLSESSINYIHFKNMGIKVYSIERDLNIENIYKRMSIEDIKSNRILLLQQYSYEVIRERIKKNLKKISMS